MKLFAIFLLILLQSCATSPVSPDKAKEVSKDKIYKYSEKKNPTDAKVTLVRDSGFSGGGCSWGFFVNNDLVADMETSERVDIYLPSGEYLLGMGSSKNNIGTCSFLDIMNTETILKDNQEKKFRMWLNGNGGYGIAPI